MIQKPYNRYILVTGFDVASKPNVFDYMNYKWWRANMVLWLTTMNIFYIA